MKIEDLKDWYCFFKKRPLITLFIILILIFLCCIVRPYISAFFSEKGKQLAIPKSPRNDLLITKEHTTPSLQYSLTPLPSNYAPGIEVGNVVWRKNFQEYLLVLKNNSSQSEIIDLRTKIDLPCGIVQKEVISQKGCENLTLSEGGFLSMATGNDQHITQVLDHHTNNLYIGATKLFPKGEITIKLIVEKLSWFKEKGSLEIDFYYYKTKDELKKLSEAYPVSLKNNNMLFIDFSNPINGTYTKTILIKLASPNKKE